MKSCQNGGVVAGHTRYKAAVKLGLKTVPCVRADQLTPKQVKAYRILDNKLNELATWDFAALGEEMKSFEFDFDGFDVALPTFNVETAFPEQGESEGQAAMSRGGAAQGGYIGNGEVSDGKGSAGPLPDELQGVDLSPTPLPTINGEDRVALDRVVIVFPADRKQEVADYLGLEKLDKAIYPFEELQPE